MIRIKRVYDKPTKIDGFRILVDQLWPRGISKEEAKLDMWMRPIAPTPGLRKWFAHDTKKFPEFTKRYMAELKKKEYMLEQIKDIENEHDKVTLLFGAKDQQHNNAVVLLEALGKLQKSA